MKTNTQGASWEERERVKRLYRPVIDLDVEPAQRIEPNFEAADKALDDLLSKERAEGERRGSQKTVEYIRKNIVDIDKRDIKDQMFELDLDELDALFEKATLPADSTEI